MHNNVFKLLLFLFLAYPSFFHLKIKMLLLRFWAISIASQNGGVSVHFCMIWGRRNTAVKRLPMTRTNSLCSHQRPKYCALTISGVKDKG